MSDTLIRLRHRHGDSWQEMDEIESPHNPAESDVERRWGRGRIFRCVRCEEDIMVEQGGEPGDRR